MGDIPVEVALSIGPSTRRARSGTRRPPGCGGWTSPEAGALLRPGVQQRQLLGYPGQPGGVVLDAAGEPVVAAPRASPCSTAARARWSSGCRSSRTGRRTGPTTSRSTAGRAWVGTMAYDKRPGNAALYRVDGDTVDPRGRRPHDLQRAGVRRGAGAPVLGRHRPVRRRRLRPRPRDGHLRRRRFLDFSARRGSGRTG